MNASPQCRLCGGATRKLFEKTLLGRAVGYHQCAGCGLTQTDEPTWLGEAYARSALHVTDTGVLARNLAAMRIAGTFLHLSGVRDEPCLDWASGWGVFVRLMRDAGFRFYCMDPYAESVVARGFDWSDALGRPRACTAFEVLEHLPRPRETFAALAARGAQWIVTSTELPPGGTPSPDWQYLSTESGMHVAFYRPDTLERLGREHGYPHVIAGPYYQVFSRTPFPRWRWHVAMRAGALLFPLLRRSRRSLTQDDHDLLRSRPE